MNKSDIFKALITVLKSEQIRTDMEFKPDQAKLQINSSISKTGLTILGIGMYSVVVEHEAHPGRVFKVSTSRWDGYRAYAKYCIEHAGEPLIPNVYSAQEQGNFAWYELEKYYPCTLTELSSTGRVQHHNNKIRDIVNMVQAATHGPSSCEYQLKHNTITRGMRKPKRDQYLNELREYMNHARKIYNTFEDTHRLDLHLGNIMITSEHEVVITDPLANDLRREIPVTEVDPEFEDCV